MLPKKVTLFISQLNKWRLLNKNYSKAPIVFEQFPIYIPKKKFWIFPLFCNFQSTARKLKIPQFFLSFQPPRWLNRRKRRYQVNLCSSLTRLPIFIVLARSEAPNLPKYWAPTPNSPKESGSSPVTSITYLQYL